MNAQLAGDLGGTPIALTLSHRGHHR
jgi:hypothetical protein